MALKLDFSKLPWQGQLGAVATLAVASVAGFWYFYASPAQTEINTQRASGKSFADIAKTEGVSEAKPIAETIKFETAECDAGVKAGQITAAERTKVLADIESRLKTAIADTSAPCGPGGPNGPAGSGTSTSSSTVTQ